MSPSSNLIQVFALEKYKFSLHELTKQTTHDFETYCLFKQLNILKYYFWQVEELFAVRNSPCSRRLLLFPILHKTFDRQTESNSRLPFDAALANIINTITHTCSNIIAIISHVYNSVHFARHMFFVSLLKMTRWCSLYSLEIIKLTTVYVCCILIFSKNFVLTSNDLEHVVEEADEGCQVCAQHR